MRLSKFASVKTALWAVLLVMPLVARGGFTPVGSESVKPGQLRGDQTMPQAAIDHTGGFLVWQDNNVGGSGLGIKAQRLDAAMNKVGGSFRVNIQTTGNHEEPRVALLRNGGAVFVWQGGREGAQRIYARFLAANGIFVSGDTRVNSYTNGYQRDPAVATLADGSVIIVWSSYGQDQSLQGVFAQRFSPRGARLGSEFQVNQTSLNNQRNPVVAALTNGNYVVAWVSELQRSSVSVDIYARLFTAAGNALVNEFPVSLSNSNACANPSIAGSLLTGGFAIAWSRDDTQRFAIGDSAGNAVVTNTAGRSTKSWDVAARLYGPAGNAITGEIAVNSNEYGDQFGPMISAFGEEYGVVWTSLAQDGSREGVFGQVLAADGTREGTEFRVNTSTASRQFQPALVSDNHSQMVAFWSGFQGGGNGFDVFAQRYDSSQVIPLDRLTNSLPVIEEPNTGLPRLESPTEAEFGEPAANGFALAVGNYHGLFFSPYGVNPASSGYLTVKTTAKRSYSGRLFLGGRSYSLKGTLDETGWGASVINRKGDLPLNVYLQVDLSGGGALRGGVTDGDWWSDLRADKQAYNKKVNPTTLAGNYTLVIRGEAGVAGEGAGVMKVDPSGAVKLGGTLADGTKFVHKGIVSKDGYWPLYANLYKGGGVLLGWLEFENQATSDVSGHVVWTKQANPAAAVFPAGFNHRFEVVGSRYSAAAPGNSILNADTGELVLSGAGFAAPEQLGFGILVNNKVTSDGRLKLTFSAKQGTFKGAWLSDSGPVGFQGVLLQKAGNGSGFFLRSGQSGKVELHAVE